MSIHTGFNERLRSSPRARRQATITRQAAENAGHVQAVGPAVDRGNCNGGEGHLTNMIGCL